MNRSINFIVFYHYCIIIHHSNSPSSIIVIRINQHHLSSFLLAFFYCSVESTQTKYGTVWYHTSMVPYQVWYQVRHIHLLKTCIISSK